MPSVDQVNFKLKARQTPQSVYILEQNHLPSRLSHVRLFICWNIDILTNISAGYTKFVIKVAECH